ncbi:MAG: Ger(x)C family spore germination C-terminal domain-containing protein [Clostridiales bacterium]|nr:Ger(x)C family spore germination C-terminal domain-containing protein [Clostridiales bacterium]MDY4143098.1 Ger(x)C family spore germination C-terminal domain-containing protein [Oscillospiraceae bacterium]
MKKFIAALCALSLMLTASGCSGGSIYSNYRDIAELLVIQTLGFDLSDAGVRLSVSAEGSTGAGKDNEGKTPVRLSVDAQSMTEAQDALQHYSGGLRLFFGHTAYIVLGENVLNTDTAQFFDCIERDAAFRLCIPVFAASGSASELVMGAGADEHDATRLMRAVTENLRLRGDAHIFTAAEIVSALDSNGAALICAVKAVPADTIDPDAAEGEMAIVPDGYTIINNNKAAGHIPMELARGVSLILNEAGSMPVVVGNATLQIDRSSCELEPVFGDGLEGVAININISASLAEARGDFDPGELTREFEAEARSWVEDVLELQKSSACDFLHLGSALEIRHPQRLRGASENFALIAPGLDFTVRVTADLDRSFHLDLF